MKSLITTIEAVIHKDFGGFYVNTEMALWLLENKNWNIEEEFHQSSDMFHHKTHDFSFRCNPDLIECVRTLKMAHKDDDYTQKRLNVIHRLEIVKIDVYAEIEDYYDGKEKITIYGI